METSLFDYHLPAEAIAQKPADRRDQSRLMRLNRATGTIGHYRFDELPTLLRPGDLLVLNDAKVIPARLAMRRKTGSVIEGLFLRELDDGLWEMMLRGRGRIREGESLEIQGAEGQRIHLSANRGQGLWTVQPQPAVKASDLLGRAGRAPLPPYIDRRGADAELDRLDAERYQTVFARVPGAVAAPTAGLHFTTELLGDLQQRDIQCVYLTLQVGLGTFRPVTTQRVEDHHMHQERFSVSSPTAESIRRARLEGRRIVAVGTTTVRVLETIVRRGEIRESEGQTELFIYPPFEFRLVDALVTNFHLPHSTLLMMVGALAGREFLLRAYAEALAKGYRFYSYGDSCLIE
ncbi:MAG: tRNA preQ1(34) S-adenosylmethionine ribosyltransferase-isomerase QueA [Anaerolineaceae bacterium]|nr:tRNA preQ1(34) S-adenosylmethionine ribosyltransferase-isomerase QueA [Anaerolineaceae bacterium]